MNLKSSLYCQNLRAVKEVEAESSDDDDDLLPYRPPEKRRMRLELNIRYQEDLVEDLGDIIGTHTREIEKVEDQLYELGLKLKSLWVLYRVSGHEAAETLGASIDDALEEKKELNLRRQNRLMLRDEAITCRVRAAQEVLGKKALLLRYFETTPSCASTLTP